jgi:hypothetical protein
MILGPDALSSKISIIARRSVTSLGEEHSSEKLFHHSGVKLSGKAKLMNKRVRLPKHVQNFVDISHVRP